METLMRSMISAGPEAKRPPRAAFLAFAGAAARGVSCVPCLREMPSLDRPQATVGDRLTILAVSQDRGGAPVVDPFLEQLRLASLRIYLDPKGALGEGLGTRGLPTTFLVDGEGRVRAQLEGAAEWDSPELLATLERYLRDPDAARSGTKTSAGRS